MELTINTIDDAAALLERLRAEEFNVSTERRLASHPYVIASEEGSLNKQQLDAFALEQLHIQRSDAVSFASLANASLTLQPGQPLSDAVLRGSAQDGDLFHFLASGEIFAAPLLERYMKWRAISDDEMARFEPSALAQAYPAMWCSVALKRQHAIGAAAVAVNFPAWGAMCRRIHTALKSGKYGEVDETDLSFLDFFATPIENLDGMAKAQILQAAQNGALPTYRELRTAVRLVQDYEVLFWDAVYAAGDTR